MSGDWRTVFLSGIVSQYDALSHQDHTMNSASGVTLIRNGQLVDGTGSPPIPNAHVIIRDGRIVYAGSAIGSPSLPNDVASIDANGGTIMPGLVEAHYHPTYFNVAALEDLDIKYPVEYVTLLAASLAQSEVCQRSDGPQELARTT